MAPTSRIAPRLSRVLLALASASLAGPAFAQSILGTPDAGQSIREMEAAPLTLPSDSSLRLELPVTEDSGVASDGARARVESFALSGNQAIGDEQLLPLLDDLKGRELSLAQLQAGVASITAYYRRQGYLLARAYLPAQEVNDGQVRIAVLEGRYGEVSVDNRSRAGGWALAPLSDLESGGSVRGDTLERSLLLVSDLPGVSVDATLRPGASVGASDLLVNVKPGPLVSGSVDLDNYGSRYTGQWRLGGTLNLNNPLGLGDAATLRLMGTDEYQTYYRLAYQLPVGPWATRVGAAFSNMRYELARDFEVLDAYGRAQIASGYLIQPLVRSRDFSLYGQLQYDYKRLHDKIDLLAFDTLKHSRVWTASLTGDARDNFGGGGVTSFALSYSSGRLTLSSVLDQAIDDLTAKTAGDFQKLTASLLRLQRLNDKFSLYTRLQGQWASKNLDSSEKLGLSGAYGVRGYPQGEASGDQGWMGSMELRYAFAPAWHVGAFVDHGRVTANKKPWAEGDNHRDLSATGLSLGWARYGWQLSAVAAWRLGSEPQSDSDRKPRVWVQLLRYF